MANWVATAALNSYLTQSIARHRKTQGSPKEETVPPTHKAVKMEWKCEAERPEQDKPGHKLQTEKQEVVKKKQIGLTRQTGPSKIN